MLALCGVLGENRRAGKAEQVILLEIPDDGRVHVPELTAVALVKDDDDMLVIDLVALILAHKVG